MIRLYTELGYSVGHISRIFRLSYGPVKADLLSLQKKTKIINRRASKVNYTTELLIWSKKLKHQKAQIARLKKEFNNSPIKTELDDEIINVTKRDFKNRIPKIWCQIILELRIKNANWCHGGHLCELLGVTSRHITNNSQSENVIQNKCLSLET